MRRFLHWFGIHTFVERRKNYSVWDGPDMWEVYESCRYCHEPKEGSWRLEEQVNG